METLVVILGSADADAEAATRAIRLFWATAGLIGLIFFGLILLVTVRRTVNRRTRDRRRERGGTADAWVESGRRLKIPPIDGDADPDEDTIDFDPDGDLPAR